MHWHAISPTGLIKDLSVCLVCLSVCVYTPIYDHPLESHRLASGLRVWLRVGGVLSLAPRFLIKIAACGTTVRQKGQGQAGCTLMDVQK